MTTIRITSSKEQFELLLAFCKSNNIEVEVECMGFTEPVLDTQFRTPNDALKFFCGTERLTTRGKVRPSEALEYVIQHAKTNNLVTPGGAIHADEILQQLFSDSTQLHMSNLPSRIEAMFTD